MNYEFKENVTSTHHSWRSNIEWLFWYKDGLVQQKYEKESQQNFPSYQSDPKSVNIMREFFENEKVEDIHVVRGKNITNYKLNIVWKALIVKLNVTIYNLDTAIFQFLVPREYGMDYLIHEKVMIPTYNKLIGK